MRTFRSSIHSVSLSTSSGSNMSKQVKPLSAAECNRAMPRDKDYPLADGQGLLLLIRTTGKKTWQFKYKRYTGKDGRMTLGDYPILSLKDARQKHRTLLTQLANGIDPIDQKNAEHAKQSSEFHFENVARAWHAAYVKTGKWHEHTAHYTLKALERYVFPEIGVKPIDTIKPRDLNLVLSKIEDQGLAEIVKKTRQRFVSIFAYAISKGYIELSPAYSLKDAIIATRKTRHHPKLPLERLPELFERLRQDGGLPITKLCLELSLHTFVRSSEMRFARWSEFDLDKAVWTLPASREKVDGYRFSDRGAKMKSPHMIPLSPQAVRILRDIHAYSGMTQNVFPKHGDPHGFIADGTVNNSLQRMGYNTLTEVCGHGFRGMACGALIESTLFSEDAVEKQMSHQERNSVRQAYVHHAKFLDERKMMLHWWSDYLDANQEQYISPYDFSAQIFERAKTGLIDMKYAMLLKKYA